MSIEASLEKSKNLEQEQMHLAIKYQATSYTEDKEIKYKNKPQAAPEMLNFGDAEKRFRQPRMTLS
jgi:hypothetical protein